MSNLRTAAQQALEALEDLADCGTEAWSEQRPCVQIGREAITALRAALAQQAEPVQEPVAICCNCLGTKRPHADDPEWKGRCDCEPPQLAEPAQEPVAWVASKDGRVIYDDASTDDGLLRVSGDFENDEQRVRYAQRIVDKLNAAPPQRTMVPLTEDEIYYATGHCGVSRYTAIKIARVVEEASWEKNHG